MMQTITENYDLEISSYQDYFSLIELLAYKTGDRELFVNFTNAERLHDEFHPRPQEEKLFKIRETHLKQLIQKLRKYL